MNTRTAIMPAAVAFLVLLQGCQVKQDEEEGSETAPQPDASESALPPPVVEESPAASIIRADVAAELAKDLPPQPLERTVPFGEGGYELDEAAVAMLRETAESAQVERGWPVILLGHTDSVGADRTNIAASRKRAQAVADKLVELGLDEDRIEIVALGEQRPIAPNAHFDGTPDEEGRAANRRVEIWVAPEGVQPAGSAGGETKENTESDEET